MNVYRLDYDNVGRSLINWNDSVDWQDEKSPAQVLNEINYICTYNNGAHQDVYKYICKQIKDGKIDEAQLCHNILTNDKYDTLFLGDQYFDQAMYNKIIDNDDITGKRSYVKSCNIHSLNREKLESIRKHCWFKSLVIRIIYSRHDLSIELFRDILQMLHDKRYRSYKDSKNLVKCTTRKILVNDVFKTFVSCCTRTELLRFSLTNRYWCNKFYQSKFIKKCMQFKTLHFKLQHINEWLNGYSSDWIFTNNLHLKISVSKQTLIENNIPRFNGTNVQYVDGVFDFFDTTKYPKKLKCLTIHGQDYDGLLHRQDYDGLLHRQDYDAWLKFDDILDSPIIFTCISRDSHCDVRKIPSSKSILWESSLMINQVVYNCIIKHECEWLCFQCCDWSLAKYYSAPESTEDVTLFDPSTKLIFMFSSYWAEFKHFLFNAAIYHKYISHLTFVSKVCKLKLNKTIQTKTSSRSFQ